MEHKEILLNLSHEDLCEMTEWIDSQFCECEDNFKDYCNCCGNSLDDFSRIEVFCTKSRVTPRFTQMDSQQKLSVLNFIEECLK